LFSGLNLTEATEGLKIITVTAASASLTAIRAGTRTMAILILESRGGCVIVLV
jgi:hypothetical protein